MSTISAGTTLTTALVQTGDTTGELVIKTNGGSTTAMTIDTAGDVGIGTSSPQAKLAVSNSGVEGFEVSPAVAIGGVVRQIAFNRSTAAYIPMRYQASEHQFYNTAGYVALFDTNGRLLVGGTTARTFSGGASTPQIQLEGTTNNGSRASIVENSTTNDPGLIFGRSRGTTLGAVTAVASGDTLGFISFQGADGTNLVQGASIGAAVDGTPGTNDMPGRLVFNTTADGASSPTERMRIDAEGNIGIGTATAPWGAANSRKAIQILNGAFVGDTTFSEIAFNDYVDAGGHKYIVDGFASSYYQSGGVHYWRTAASGLANASIAYTNVMQVDTSGNLYFNSGYGSIAAAYGCRAWVNFNGTGVVAIRADGNVTSITDNGTGDYTVNFTTAMVDANYGIAGAAGNHNNFVGIDSDTAIPTTTAARVSCMDAGNVRQDGAYVCVAIFR